MKKSQAAAVTSHPVISSNKTTDGQQNRGEEAGGRRPVIQSLQQQPSPDDVFQSMLEEMVNKKFDVIRFPAYRAACKLRFIQKKTNMQQVDIWNVIEAIRENGLHAMSTASSASSSSPDPLISSMKLHTLITSIYYQLSKRLAPSQRMNLDESSSLLHCFLLATFDPESQGVIRVSSIKLSLVILCSGKIEDKLTYIFSILSDASSGCLLEDKFKSFIRDLLSLATGVLDYDPYFSYDDSLSTRILMFDHKIKLKEFTEILLNPKSAPICFSFFMAFTRMSEVEQVMHPVSCQACHVSGFTGFRYKCQKCFNFNLCQDCFWRGRSASSHDPDTHPCREYSFWQSQSASIRRSFRCLPSHKAPKISLREEAIIDSGKRIDLKHIVPASPVAKHHMNRIAPVSPFTRGSIAYGSLPNMGNNSPILRPAPPTPVHMTGRNFNETANSATSSSGVIENDEEHELVAQYARKLQTTAGGITPLSNRKAFLTTSAAAAAKSAASCNGMNEKHKLISQLESRNREVMREIERLRRGEVSSNDKKLNGSSPAQEEDTYVTELSALRMRKEELEKHLTALQDSRKDLLIQLESLMKLLKNHGNLLISNPSSAASTLNQSQQSMRTTTSGNAITPSHSFRINNETRAASLNPPSVAATGSRSRSSSNHASAKAECVKNAMSCLVKELDSEDEAAIDELGLKLSKKLKVQSGSRIPSTTATSTASGSVFKSPTATAAAAGNNSSSGSSKANNTSNNSAGDRKRVDDIDEDELALAMLRNQMMAMRKSQSEGLDSSRFSTSRSAYSRDSFLSDDDTDIYPETDDEFYTSTWINQERVDGHRS